MKSLRWRTVSAFWDCGLIFFIFASLMGCSMSPRSPVQPIEPIYPINQIIRDDIETLQVSDPWEGFNRRMYRFNYGFDKYILLPVVNGYAYVTPDFFEDRISSFFLNLGEINNLFNSLLQFKGKVLWSNLGGHHDKSVMISLGGVHNG